ncbi:hypothetical protein N9E48_02610 [Paracoccaceae bacterium]|nr:hypothetical protein [Paracoccaceae bacterium]
MLIEEKQVEDFIKNLKGRINYEAKKATKLGFSSLDQYVRDKLSKKPEKTEIKSKCMRAPKASNIVVKKSKMKKNKTCGCC